MERKIVFKKYDMTEVRIDVPLDVLIPSNHPVMVVNKVIDSLDISGLMNKYVGGGASAFHPLMLLKVIIFAYTQGIYTGRKIERALRENINFMWISANNKPDFRTINKFRSEKLQDQIDKIFEQVIQVLMKEGCISLDACFVDGTKIESAANKYTFVWKKSTQKYDEKARLKLKTILNDIKEETKLEDSIYGDLNFPEIEKTEEIPAEKIKETVDAINAILTEKQEKSGSKKKEKF